MPDISGALLVPIHLDALFVENEEVVLHSMADFSKLPFFDGQHNQNSDVAYLSEEIVSKPFRDKDLRLGKGAHLHWALPDALTQGVSTKDGITFPAAPDRWLVTRTDANGKQQWIVESDYIYPLDTEMEIGILARLNQVTDPAKRKSREKSLRAAFAKELAQKVNFPIPPRVDSVNKQPYRYLGRHWPIKDGLPPSDQKTEYLNALAHEKGKKNAWHKVVESGLTAMGYGEPAFAAFYPNCRSVFGFYDADISFEDFKTSTYDVIGWFDQPETRDCLQNEAVKHTRLAIGDRLRNELSSSGFSEAQITKKINAMDVEIQNEAIENHFGWKITQKWDDSEKLWQDLPAAELVPLRSLYHAQLKPVEGISPNLNDDSLLGAVDVAIGNTASEALSAYLGDKIAADKSLIEEQLEALDLGQRFQHRQLDLGPKFLEARHNKGFCAERSGILWTVRLERDPAYEESSETIHATTEVTPPIYIAHLLNDLNEFQAKYDRAEHDMDALRCEIYHDWTLYMRALRPPEGMSEGYSDPIEIAKFIDRAGLTMLKRLQAANGRFNLDAQQRAEIDARSSPITSKPATDYTDSNAIAAKIAEKITDINKAFDIANDMTQLLQKFELKISHLDADIRKETNQYFLKFLEEFNALPTAPFKELSASFSRIKVRADSLSTIAQLEQFQIKLGQLYWLLFPSEHYEGDEGGDEPLQSLANPEKVKMRYVLREIDAPRYYRPTDPVVLLAGEKLKPTERHGTDGKDDADGKHACRVITNITKSSLISDIDIPPITQWIETTSDERELSKALLEKLGVIREAVLKVFDEPVTAANSEEDGCGGGRYYPEEDDQIGLRRWRKQPWHPFMMEWQVEMAPVSAGSNRDAFREDYANDFIRRNFNLPENSVDLCNNSNTDLELNSADTGFYSGSCILIDQAPDILQYKLDKYLEANKNPLPHSKPQSKPFKEDQAIRPQSLAKQKTLDTLNQVKAFLEARPKTLSQSLDGFHQGLLQRHQILQLPITDPIGFKDLQLLTDSVRLATQGRHTSSPMRGYDFTPIRSGQLKLRQLRLIDTFGRVKRIIDADNQTKIVRSETLSLKDSNEGIHLAPRLVQAARLNFRWLSAEHASGSNMDEAETNAHPAYTPVCGWLMANHEDNILEVFNNQGIALGAIRQEGDHVVWQKAPGSTLPHWEIENPESSLNPHLRKWLNTMVNQLGKQASYFKHFMDTLSSALETIAPEDFSHHQSKALLIGRPMAIVRTMVDLELKGRPAVNQSDSAFKRDMQRSVGPQQGDQETIKQRRAQFRLVKSEQAEFLRGLETRNPKAIRHAFITRQFSLPYDNELIQIKLKSSERDQRRWQIIFPTKHYQVRENNGVLDVFLETDRSSDDFTHVRFPIRIGEYQQLNDGLIGYFIEEPDGTGYHYQDNCFYAPQAASRQPLPFTCPAEKIDDWVELLNQRTLPEGILEQLPISIPAAVTIDKTGYRWRIDSDQHVFNLLRDSDGMALFEVLDSKSEHIKVHWKDPVNLYQSVDDAPHKLTMLIDPQGSVHAVSGILPTKAINIPVDQYVEAINKLEITFPVKPVVSELGKVQIPLTAVQGYQWTWLSKSGERWTETDQIDRIDTRAHFSRQQSLIEGFLKLQKTDK
ncbi:hypothetical protein [Neptunomonas sp.]|uniref:hypothetical protein n=1 Tax=Neptunomonas sp. TaxID=1971898 RepID=UPI00356AC920